MVNKNIMKIGQFEIGGDKTFVIAEIGNNHNGDFKRAKQMIDKAIEMKVDCVKFQMRQIKEVYRNKSITKSGEDLGTEYIIDLLERFELSVDQHKELANYCRRKNILYLCTPWDLQSVDILESFNVPAYKVASADLTNLELLGKLAMTKKPLILSTGMSKVEEVEFSLKFLSQKKVDFALLHCNSTYPAPVEDINLRWIKSLEKMHPIIGYSGHERGINISIAAVALGAKIIERHFTLDRNMEGPDHSASLEFKEFRELVRGIREVEKSLGTDKERILSQGEMINRENLGKSLVASKDLKKGTLLKKEHIKVLSPGQGLSPQKIEHLIGKRINRDMVSEDFFFASDLGKKKRKASNYKFDLRWGIPVRFHDFRKYNEIVEPEIYEFHLSYSDMDLDPNDFLEGEYQSGLVVHAPELFQGSHLMDLTSNDNKYRNFSIKQTQRVIDLTRDLKKFFPNEIKPLIVANIGGFTMDKPLDDRNKEELYLNYINSLNLLDTDGVEIIPQTMAPFPWHFGGQRYQNLFVEIEEIIKYCKEYNIRMCFDVSHSMLTCNHFGGDFYMFAEKIAEYSAHIHIGDAKGSNGEGLQIGEGEIDFQKLGKIIKRKCSGVSFIPEIWQGHKNDGEGFWIALDRLKGLI